MRLIYLYEGFQEQKCDHLLLHYLMSLLATAALRPAQPVSDQLDNGGLLTRREARTALLIRLTPMDVMLPRLRAALPSR